MMKRDEQKATNPVPAKVVAPKKARIQKGAATYKTPRGKL
jgi:hypothetical protein